MSHGHCPLPLLQDQLINHQPQPDLPEDFIEMDFDPGSDAASCRCPPLLGS